MSESLFEKFKNVVVLDLETTGLFAHSDEIIEFGALRVSEGAVDEDDVLIRLSAGHRLPPGITRLTGIAEDRLFYAGVEKAQAAARMAATGCASTGA